MTTMQPHRRATGGTLLALGLLLVLAASAHAKPKVAVTGTTTVGTKLTAKITGGKSRGITWQACAVKPSGRTCPAANLTRLGTKRTYTLTDTTTGAYIRAQAKVRPKKGKTRTVTSPWRGPITTPDNGGGGGGGGGCAAPASTSPTPTATLFAMAEPVSKSMSSFVDARGSSDPNGRPLTYSWDLDGDCVFGDQYDSDTPGLASISAVAQPPIVRVRVTTSGGGVAQAELRITWTNLIRNGSITLPFGADWPGTPMTISVNRGDDTVRVGCLDPDGDGIHNVRLEFDDINVQRNYNGTAAGVVGFHVLSATLWTAGANDDCRNTGTSGAGLVQVVRLGYMVRPVPTRRTKARQGAAKNRKYVATSNLRLNQTPFTLPTVEEFLRQQAANTPPKAQPINGKGPITASTGKKARGLNGTCKSLRKYLR